jgi:hypothetical protein
VGFGIVDQEEPPTWLTREKLGISRFSGMEATVQWEVPSAPRFIATFPTSIGIRTITPVFCKTNVEMLVELPSGKLCLFFKQCKGAHYHF